MGLIPTICRFLILLHKQVGLQGPVLTLGNQDVWANYDEIRDYFIALDSDHIEVTPVPHTSKLLSQYQEAKAFIHAKTFFQMLGINEYYDVDLLEADSPSFVHDLNHPTSHEFEGKFGLI